MTPKATGRIDAWSKSRRVLSLGLCAVSVGLIAITLLGMAAPWWWLGQGAEHARLHLLVPLSVVTLLLIKLNHARFASATAACFIFSLVMIFLFAPPVAPRAATGHIEVMHLNLDRNNTQAADVIRGITGRSKPEASPDIVCLQELTPDWEKRLRDQLDEYDWVISIPRKDSRGVAMLVRRGRGIEVTSKQVLQWLPGETDRPTLAVEFFLPERNNSRFVVLSIHTKRPTGATKSITQQREFDAAAAWCKALLAQDDPPLLLAVGDFNTTPWASNYRRFIAKAGLRQSNGFFNSPTTYPASWPSLMRAPIDLAAVSPGLSIHSASSGEPNGSDHLPLYIELHVPSKAADQLN